MHVIIKVFTHSDFTIIDSSIRRATGGEGHGRFIGLFRLLAITGTFLGLPFTPEADLVISLPWLSFRLPPDMEFGLAAPTGFNCFLLGLAEGAPFSTETPNNLECN